MSFDAILEAIMKHGGGVVGILLVVMLWFNYTLVTKLFEVIKTNTEVITAIKGTLVTGNDLIKTNTDLITRHQSEDQRHRDQCERTHNEVHSINTTMIDISQTLENIYQKVVKA